MSNRVVAELEHANIQSFNTPTDDTYCLAFQSKFTNFAAPRSSLVSSAGFARFYNKLKQKFPICHLVFTTGVFTKYFMVESKWLPGSVLTTESSVLSRKKHRVLHLFLDMLKTRNWRLLPHSSMVQPLAYWFKGSHHLSIVASGCWHQWHNDKNYDDMQSKNMPSSAARGPCLTHLHVRRLQRARLLV